VDSAAALLIDEIPRLLFVGLGAAILYLETWSVGQFLITRPTLLFPILGLLLGMPVEGVWVGILLELLSNRQLPMGAILPPDPVSAGLLAILAVWLPGAALLPAGLPRLLTVILLGIVLLWPTVFLTEIQRRINTVFWLPYAQKAVEQTREKTLSRMLPLVLLQTYTLAATVFALGVFLLRAPAQWLHQWIADYLPLQMEQSLFAPWTGGLANLPFYMLALALGGIAQIFGSKLAQPKRKPFRMGLFLGAAFFLLTLVLAGAMDG
jgi:mannose/fructose/N-acetylgalactosamine-specific phosphotransferase system component IIC